MLSICQIRLVFNNQTNQKKTHLHQRYSELFMGSAIIPWTEANCISLLFWIVMGSKTHFKIWAANRCNHSTAANNVWNMEEPLRFRLEGYRCFANDSWVIGLFKLTELIFFSIFPWNVLLSYILNSYFTLISPEKTARWVSRGRLSIWHRFLWINIYSK